MEINLYDEIIRKRKIYVPKMVNLDELCFLWFITKMRLPEPIRIEFVDSLTDLPLDQAFVIGFEGFLTIQVIPPGQSLSKLFYRDYLKHREMFDLPATHSLVMLVDYCTRAVRRKLSDKEKQPGSFVHVIYTLRSFGVAPERLLEVFDYLANRILEEPEFLSTMCDVELDIFDNTLSRYLYEADKARSAIISKHVYFRFVDSFFIAVNNSDHNVAKFIFHDFPYVKLYVFSSPVTGLTGVIVRKGFKDFNLSELYDRILAEEKNSGVKWIKKGNMIINSFGRASDKQTSITTDKIIDLIMDMYDVDLS